MSKVSWVAKPVTTQEKVNALVLSIVNEVESNYGERYLTLGSVRIEETVGEIQKLIDQQVLEGKIEELGSLLGYSTKRHMDRIQDRLAELNKELKK